MALLLAGSVHAPFLSLDSLQQDLQNSVQSLLDYQVTLKRQGARISELEGDAQILRSHNETLEEQVGDLEIKLRRTAASKESLELKAAQLVDGTERMWSLCLEFYLMLSLK